MLAWPPLDAAEMREQRRTLVRWIPPLQPQLRAEQRVASGRVDGITRAMPTRAARSLDLRRCAVGVEFDARHLRALLGLRAALAGKVEEQLVELVPPHLVGERPGRVQAPIEAEYVVAAL